MNLFMSLPFDLFFIFLFAAHTYSFSVEPPPTIHPHPQTIIPAHFPAKCITVYCIYILYSV